VYVHVTYNELTSDLLWWNGTTRSILHSCVRHPSNISSLRINGCIL